MLLIWSLINLVAKCIFQDLKNKRLPSNILLKEKIELIRMLNSSLESLSTYVDPIFGHF